MTLRSISLILLGSALGLSACGDKSGDDTSSTDTDTDTDADTDADSDTDADADSDTDSDTDTDADADTDADCDEHNMIFAAEVREDGDRCVTCSANTDLDLTAVIINPCPHELPVRTTSSCLVGSYEMIALDAGTSESVPRDCDTAETDWLVPAHDQIEEQVGTWSSGTEAAYRLVLHFDDIHETPAVVTFDIEARR